MKYKGFFLLLTCLTFGTLSGASFVWGIVETITYIAEKNPINLWCLPAFIISTLLTIITYAWIVGVAANIREQGRAKLPKAKSAFQERLERLAEEKKSDLK